MKMSFLSESLKQMETILKAAISGKSIRRYQIFDQLIVA